MTNTIAPAAKTENAASRRVLPATAYGKIRLMAVCQGVPDGVILDGAKSDVTVTDVRELGGGWGVKIGVLLPSSDPLVPPLEIYDQKLFVHATPTIPCTNFYRSVRASSKRELPCGRGVEMTTFGWRTN